MEVAIAVGVIVVLLVLAFVGVSKFGPTTTAVNKEYQKPLDNDRGIVPGQGGQDSGPFGS